MERFVVSVVLCIWTIAGVIQPSNSHPNYGVPLFLTPLIRSGNLTGARKESQAVPLKGNIASFSGFITVDDKYESNLFFWYFPAEVDPSKAPVILWLQGGPGESGLTGVFEENGPFYVKIHRGLKMRKYYWSRVAHMIYIDSPVGTGFSFTNSTGGYAKNLDSIVDNLYEFLLQYFTIFEELTINNFYIVGESYGANCAIMLANRIHSIKPRELLKINLKGIALQNGIYDPRNMIVYHDYLYQIGLVDLIGMNVIKQEQSRIVQLIDQKDYVKAYGKYNAMIGGNINQKTSFQNLTYYNSYYNFLHNEDDAIYGEYEKYLQKDMIRRALHVGNLTFNTGRNVKLYLVNDLMLPVKTTMEQLLENYEVMVYVGQMDIIVTYPMTEYVLQQLRWSGALQYGKAPRQLWKVDDVIAGYVKNVKNFTEILVRNAGHRVSYDQPKWALDMLKRFVSGEPFLAP